MKDVRVPENLQRAMAAEAEAARNARAKVFFMMVMIVMIVMMTRIVMIFDDDSLNSLSVRVLYIFSPR